MTFRTRLLLVFTIAIVAAVGIVELLAQSITRQTFEHEEEQRAAALSRQFRKEFQRRGQEIVRAVNAIASGNDAADIAIASDPARYYDTAASLAASHGLDLLELIAGDGSIVSSAEWPARFNYHEDWVLAPVDWKNAGAFLRPEELEQGTVLALVAVGVATAGDRRLYVTGGERLDREFLSTLVLPEGMRVLLYRNLSGRFSPAELIGVDGPAADAADLRPFIERSLQGTREITAIVGAEAIRAMPLPDDSGRIPGVLLIANSRRQALQLESSLLWTGIFVAATGIVIGIALSWWATARVTRPVLRLADSAARVAKGDLSTTVDIPGGDEIARLAAAFNRMTGELAAQRERLVQAERVAAWRELARRLAHELKNPLFPLQITVENMQRARDRYPDQFDEVFREGTATLLAELAQLKQIIARFSDFARMPTPEIQPTDLNALAAETVRFFEPQLAQARVAAALQLDPALRPVPADPEQIRRVLRNLVLNAIDAMSAGGALTIRTASLHNGARLEISDTGAGLTPEECQRLFTPYYTTKTHGTGLGLAIVQSVISDHHGHVSVQSEKGRGSTFRIELYGTPSDR
ncbi:MAG: HAMP domain-containing protein [Acidobacteriota bacterium]|nr:HAMP domain-containing protein [Acidobacteriota bacterium]